MEKEYIIRPRLETISPEQIDDLYQSALKVLKTTGVQVLNQYSLELLKKAGCQVVEENIVKINKELINKCIETTPKTVRIYDRSSNESMILGGKNTGGLNTYYGTGSDLTFNYDTYTGEIRKTKIKDIANMAKVVDSLENISFTMSYGLPSDCPPEKIFRTEFMEMAKNTIKPIVFTCDDGNDTNNIIQMAAAAVGGIDDLKEKPFIICYSQPTSPLRLSSDAIEKVIECARNSIPVVFPPGIMPGATGPSTMAGTIIQSIAEALSCLVVHQLENSGAPIILCGAHGNMDMQSGINIYASPQRLKTEAVLASFYQHFEIPTWGFGGSTDSQILDEQAGMEFALMVQWASLCGINLAHDTGYMGSGMVGDLKAIVFNNEIISYVRHLLLEGITVNSETRAIDIINSVGPGGNYLGEAHTLNNFKKEFWQTNLMNRENLDSWTNKGKTRLIEKLETRVKDILDNHTPAELDQERVKGLEEILNK